MTAPAPYRLSDCQGDRIPPLVLASPHSGRHYPPEFLARVACDEHSLRKAEDAWVDRLFARAATTFDLPFLQAKFARTYLDLNRAADEIDPDVVAGMQGAVQNDRLRAGLGVIPRVATPGVPLYKAKLPRSEASTRLSAVHEPYHSALATLLRRARAANGYAVLLDCHSMPPLPASGGRSGAEIVIGDRHGKSCDESFRLILRRELGRHFRIAENRPYAGGHSTQAHGRPAEGIHALQIEIDRSLYMDLETLLPGEGFAQTEQALHDVVGAFLDAVAMGAAPPLAAE